MCDNFTKQDIESKKECVTEDGQMYVWGAEIFGEVKRPRKVKLQNYITVNNVIVGGSFFVTVDSDSKAVGLDSNSNGEIGVGNSQVLTILLASRLSNRSSNCPETRPSQHIRNYTIAVAQGSRPIAHHLQL